MAGAGGCSAAWATQVARLAVARAGVCRRCDAVGAVKTAEVAGARGCSAAEYCSGGVRGRVHSTRPSEGVELQGRGPQKCTAREQGPQQSTVRERRSVWWGPQHPSVGGGGGGATGARPAEVYCKGEGAAAEYCTRAEECVVGSTTPVRRGGGAAELQGRGPRKCTVREQGPQQSTVRERRSVWWGPQHPSVAGGLSYRGEARGSVL